MLQNERSVIDKDWFDSTGALYMAKLLCSTANGIILTLEEACLRNLQTCKCREDTQNCLCNYFMKCCMKLGVCFWGWIAFILVFIILLLVISDHKVVPFLGVFVLQFLISWTLQIGGLYLKFRAGWRRDRKMMEKLKKSESFMMESLDIKDNDSNALVRFTRMLKRKKQFKCPYYVTYEDSNRWIERHPEYTQRKVQRKKDGLRATLLSDVFHQKSDLPRDRILSTTVLPEFSDSDDFMDSESGGTPQPEMSSGPVVYRLSWWISFRKIQLLKLDDYVEHCNYGKSLF